MISYPPVGDDFVDCNWVLRVPANSSVSKKSVPSLLNYTVPYYIILLILCLILN